LLSRAVQVSNDLPYNDYFEYFGPDFQLLPNISSHFENHNSRAYLEGIKSRLLEKLRMLEGAPSVAMHQIPPDAFTYDVEDDDIDPDVTKEENSHRNEYYD
jgi:hypothetical protein